MRQLQPTVISGRRVVVGRGQNCDLRIPQNVSPVLYLSREHAEIACADGTCRLSDLSQNGTFVNGVRACKTPGSTALSVGDIVTFCPPQFARSAGSSVMLPNPARFTVSERADGSIVLEHTPVSGGAAAEEAVATASPMPATGAQLSPPADLRTAQPHASAAATSTAVRALDGESSHRAASRRAGLKPADPGAPSPVLADLPLNSAAPDSAARVDQAAPPATRAEHELQFVQVKAGETTLGAVQLPPPPARALYATVREGIELGGLTDEPFAFAVQCADGSVVSLRRAQEAIYEVPPSARTHGIVVVPAPHARAQPGGARVGAGGAAVEPPAQRPKGSSSANDGAPATPPAEPRARAQQPEEGSDERLDSAAAPRAAAPPSAPMPALTAAADGVRASSRAHAHVCDMPPPAADACAQPDGATAHHAPPAAGVALSGGRGVTGTKRGRGQPRASGRTGGNKRAVYTRKPWTLWKKWHWGEIKSQGLTEGYGYHNFPFEAQWEQLPQETKDHWTAKAEQENDKRRQDLGSNDPQPPAAGVRRAPSYPAAMGGDEPREHQPDDAAAEALTYALARARPCQPVLAHEHDAAPSAGPDADGDVPCGFPMRMDSIEDLDPTQPEPEV